MPITMCSPSLRNGLIRAIAVASVPNNRAPISLSVIGVDIRDGTFLRGELTESELHAQCPALVSTPALLNEFTGKHGTAAVIASAAGGIRVHFGIAIGATDFRLMVFLTAGPLHAMVPTAAQMYSPAERAATINNRRRRDSNVEPNPVPPECEDAADRPVLRVRRRHVVKVEDCEHMPRKMARSPPREPLREPSQDQCWGQPYTFPSLDPLQEVFSASAPKEVRSGSGTPSPAAAEATATGPTAEIKPLGLPSINSYTFPLTIDSNGTPSASLEDVVSISPLAQ